MMTAPAVTVVIPSYNQAAFLKTALASVFDQSVAVEAIVVDGGSTDSSVDIIKRFESRLLWWRSCQDAGQAAAINEGASKGRAPYVCWLNSDDLYLAGGLPRMIQALQDVPEAPAVYGRCLIIDERAQKKKAYWTAPFSEKHLANRCFIAQPATLIRRSAWEQVGGLDERLRMSFDYDLWWRLYKRCGSLQYLREVVAASRYHQGTKTNRFRRAHYRESMMVVRKHHGSVPLKWYVAWPIHVYLWHYVNKATDVIGI